MTGRPAAIASRITVGKPSRSPSAATMLGTTTKSASPMAATTAPVSSSGPLMATFSSARRASFSRYASSNGPCP